jgi:hypothetical protein
MNLASGRRGHCHSRGVSRDHAMFTWTIWGLTATVTATTATSPYLGRTSTTAHMLVTAHDLAVCYT